MFSRIFQSHKMHLLALLGHFQADMISHPFHVLQLVKSLHFPEDSKMYPFWVEPPSIDKLVLITI